MKVDKSLTTFLFAVGTMQIIAGLLAIVWAWPQFADPPFLHNGLTHEYSELRGLLSSTASAAEPLLALRSKLEWLFQQHINSLLLVLALGSTLAASGLVSLLLAARSRRPANIKNGARV